MFIPRIFDGIRIVRYAIIIVVVVMIDKAIINTFYYPLVVSEKVCKPIFFLSLYLETLK